MNGLDPHKTLVRSLTRAVVSRLDRSSLQELSHPLNSLKREPATCCTDSTYERQDLIRGNFIGLFDQAVLQATSPRNPQFGVDVDDINPGGNRLPQVFIVGSRSTVQCERHLSRILDLGDSLDIQVL